MKLFGASSLYDDKAGACVSGEYCDVGDMEFTADEWIDELEPEEMCTPVEFDRRSS